MVAFMSERDLEAEVDQLRAQLQALREQLDGLTRYPGASLRRHNRCPACGGTSILHVAEVRDHNYGDAHTGMAIQIKGVFKRKLLGAFEVFVCRQCELAEWYVKGAGEIDPENLDKANRKNVVIIDGTPPEDGPFR